MSTIDDLHDVAVFQTYLKFNRLTEWFVSASPTCAQTRRRIFQKGLERALQNQTLDSVACDFGLWRDEGCEAAMREFLSRPNCPVRFLTIRGECPSLSKLASSMRESRVETLRLFLSESKIPAQDRSDFRWALKLPRLRKLTVNPQTSATLGMETLFGDLTTLPPTGLRSIKFKWDLISPGKIPLCRALWEAGVRKLEFYTKTDEALDLSFLPPNARLKVKSTSGWFLESWNSALALDKHFRDFPGFQCRQTFNYEELAELLATGNLNRCGKTLQTRLAWRRQTDTMCLDGAFAYRTLSSCASQLVKVKRLLLEEVGGPNDKLQHTIRMELKSPEDGWLLWNGFLQVVKFAPNLRSVRAIVDTRRAFESLVRAVGRDAELPPQLTYVRIGLADPTFDLTGVGQVSPRVHLELSVDVRNSETLQKIVELLKEDCSHGVVANLSLSIWLPETEEPKLGALGRAIASSTSLRCFSFDAFPEINKQVLPLAGENRSVRVLTVWDQKSKPHTVLGPSFTEYFAGARVILVSFDLSDQELYPFDSDPWEIVRQRPNLRRLSMKPFFEYLKPGTAEYDLRYQYLPPDSLQLRCFKCLPANVAAVLEPPLGFRPF